MADLQQTIEELAATVTGYIKDAATLTVKTTSVAEDGSQTAVATTVLRLDGDAEHQVPVRTENGRRVVETDLLELHERSVKAATDYRAQLLGSFIAALGTLTRPGS